MKVLQINTTLNTTSTGKIAEGIGQALLQEGHESYIASAWVGRDGSSSKHIPIGNASDRYRHAFKSRLLDRHGFGSKSATQNLVTEIQRINPDVIGLHNVHGYYLNIDVLFKYLKDVQKPIVWTFHDCWPFTGHCSHFDYVGCDKWKTECFDCPLSHRYPASWYMDNSTKNFHQKKELFNGLKKLTIVTPSHWLKKLVAQSFLHNYPVEVINNGIELDQFKSVNSGQLKLKYNLEGKKIVLGVASVWDRIKGFSYFIELSKQLDDSFRIILIGLSEEMIRNLPKNIIGIPRTENMDELVSFYSMADVFVNPTLVDNFPTTNLEALACGTPVITFDTGGSPEAISSETGFVVVKRDSIALQEAVTKVVVRGKDFYTSSCRARAEEKYDKNDRFAEYVNLYKEVSKQVKNKNLEHV